MKQCPDCSKEARLIWTREGPRCIRCARGSQLGPSERQMMLFSRGFAGSFIAQVLLLPIGIPLLVLSTFLGALWKRIDGAWRMLPGVVALFLFWILLLPPLLDEPSGASFVVVFLFLLLIIFLQFPTLFVSRNMLLRGHGLLAGVTLSATSGALLLSLLVPFFILLF